MYTVPGISSSDEAESSASGIWMVNSPLLTMSHQSCIQHMTLGSSVHWANAPQTTADMENSKSSRLTTSLSSSCHALIKPSEPLFGLVLASTRIIVIMILVCKQSFFFLYGANHRDHKDHHYWLLQVWKGEWWSQQWICSSWTYLCSRDSDQPWSWRIMTDHEGSRRITLINRDP